jgi:hypothetical protein
MNDIKYPTVGFEHASGTQGNSVWGLKFRCGVCGYSMNMHSDVLSHSGLGEHCPQFRAVFEPVIDAGVFRLRIRILEPERIETTTSPEFRLSTSSPAEPPTQEKGME